MGTWKSLCNDDPLLRAVQSTYKATPLRNPTTSVVPLLCLRSDGIDSDLLGSLGDALEGDAKFDVPLKTAKNIDVLSQSTRKLDASFGLDILGGYLRAFGLATNGLDAGFNGVTQLSISFAGVERTYVEALALGKVIRGRTLDVAGNPALADFLDPETHWGFYVIDSVLTSPNISIKIESSRDVNFKFNVDALKKELGSAKAGVDISSADGTQLSVSGNVPMTFAFSVFRFYLLDGKITSIDPGAEIPSFAFSAEEPIPTRVLLSDAPAMLDLSAP